MKMRYFATAARAVAIMGFEYAESGRPIPVFADRRLRVDEQPRLETLSPSLSLFAGQSGVNQRPRRSASD